mgnify:CR=1 FL=1
MDRAVQFLLEIWMCPQEDGEVLPSCVPLGPAGDRARELNEPGSVCVLVFWARSHFDAMNFYNEFLGLGPYSTEHQQDHHEYPSEWLEKQRQYLLAL